MTRRSFRKSFFLLTLLCVGAATACKSAGAAAGIPNPAVDDSLAKTNGERTVVLAGGCFWGIEAVFEHVKGVKDAVSGYSGGAAQTAQYEIVSEGRTGHAESVQITYDPSQITYGQLLKVFFSVAHDPTQLNQQGPDIGTQYRSVIFYSDEGQKRIAQGYTDQLNQSKIFRRRVVTQLVPLKAFYKAETYHQDYAAHHPTDLYIVFNDAPKVTHLREQLPELYKAK